MVFLGSPHIIIQLREIHLVLGDGITACRLVVVHRTGICGVAGSWRAADDGDAGGCGCDREVVGGEAGYRAALSHRKLPQLTLPQTLHPQMLTQPLSITCTPMLAMGLGGPPYVILFCRFERQVLCLKVRICLGDDLGLRLLIF